MAEVVSGLEVLDVPAARAKPAEGTHVPVDHTYVASIFHDLAGLLRDENMAAEACFDRLAEVLEASHAEEIEQVRESIDSLEFEEALGSLARIAAALDIATNE